MTGAPMPEPKSRRGPALVAVVVATLLALVSALGSVAAVLGGCLAQPVYALAVRWWRGTGPAPTRATAGRDAMELLALWSAAAAVAALLVAWPLSTLLRSGSLGAVLALSVATGIG